MAESSPSSVSSAFEVLIEEIDAELELVNSRGAEAFTSGDYAAVDAARRRVEALAAFRLRAAALQRDWRQMAAGAHGEPDRPPTAGPLSMSEYRLPIIRVLADMGGSGSVHDVLDQVLLLMEPLLGEADYEPMPRQRGRPRWDSMARRARRAMREDGLIRDGSRRGVWEISDAGREHLRQSG